VETRSRPGPTERSSWTAHLPPEVVAEVQRRRAEILDRAQGRLLDISEPGALDVVLAASFADSEPSPAERYDTIVSTCRLIDVADLPGVVVGLRRLLATDGQLQVVEPVNRPGNRGLLTSSLGALLPAVAGLHLGRDVVRVLRSERLAVVDLDRFTVATRVWPLRRFVEARAVLLESFELAAISPTESIDLPVSS
jgi:hypothetical protein